ncbi:MAG: hypothetical protein A3F54_04940 [Candidatus Kerfeldbacteria bacterium RIFCSPHIGHO2_12_FULL_48_17]|uniref:Methyltransferase domain-containing protein n=1 Tax=Candidatus Kerfeldbacteria bacterium RIFCSPHIGHO2_12_FULL_48_17 TaxID=1798542 RepID=A0A1G2B3C2_9BACT|nr:MAG: hypothetical protein A3F54_04940 [Candidatus Kerfeldbacteria bacterium RIFCSPHIGHO2_12_FULL_48_17]
MYILLFIVVILLGTMAYAGYSAAPWVPTRARDVKRILQMADIRAGEKVVDVGCGDGRLVVAAARDCGAYGVGVDIGIPQYIHAQIMRMRQDAAVRGRTRIVWGDLFQYNLCDADVVVVYLLSKSYDRLVKKFEKELKPGARVVVEAWPVSVWEPTKVDKGSKQDVPLYLYKR